MELIARKWLNTYLLFSSPIDNQCIVAGPKTVVDNWIYSRSQNMLNMLTNHHV